MGVPRRSLLILAIAVAACEVGTEPLVTPPDHAGTVQSLSDNDWSHILRIATDAGGVIAVHVTDGTQLYRRTAECGLRSMDVAELIANRRVEVWTTGLAARSAPMQVGARQVVWVQGITNGIVQIADSFRAVVDTNIVGDSSTVMTGGGGRLP